MLKKFIVLLLSAVLILALIPAGQITVSALGEPPVLVSAATTADGTKVILSFDKAMSDPAGTQDQFAVSADATPDAVTSAALGSDTTKIMLTLTTAAAYGQSVAVAYTAGAVTASDGGVLASFGPQAVTNTVVSTIRACGLLPVCRQCRRHERKWEQRGGKRRGADGRQVRYRPETRIILTAQTTISALPRRRAFPSGTAPGLSRHGVRCVGNNPGNTYQGMVCYGNKDGGQAFYVERYPDDHTCWLCFWHVDLIGATPIGDGQWTHIAVTHDGTTQKMYINGELDTSFDRGIDTVLNAEGLNIGFTPNGPWRTNAYFYGAIDEVYIYNRALSQSEIRALADVVPAVTGVAAGTASLASGGGTSVITVTGTSLSDGITVTGFVGGVATAVTGTTTGNATTQTVTLTFPANVGPADKVYTVKGQSRTAGRTGPSARTAVTVNAPAPAVTGVAAGTGHACLRRRHKRHHRDRHRSLRRDHGDGLRRRRRHSRDRDDHSGNGTTQTVTLTFPAIVGPADKVYTVKASLDGGTNWAVSTVTVTVNAPAFYRRRRWQCHIARA